MLKLIDFGLSKEYRPGHRMNEAVGTLYSMAPEVLSGAYSQGCDMWSIGVVAFMLLSGNMPFGGTCEAEVIRMIKACEYSFEGETWRTVSEEAKNFVSSLIRAIPGERLTAEEALNHAWLKREWEDHRKLHSQMSDRELGESIVSSLKQFGKYGKLRKAALMVIAHRADVEKIKGLRDAFHEIDTSHEGTITLEEMKTVLTQYHIDNDEIVSIFRGMDVDKSGKIGYTEFLAATVEAHGVAKEEQLLEAFDRLDADDSGFISEENLKEILGSAYDAAEVRSMIAEADIKKNGQIDTEEFLVLMEEQRRKDKEEILQAE
jgi:calcium-dependent protein kinase